MSYESRRPRCECCDEVLEELLTMRQNFEKLFHRLGNQIVELRRELNDVLNEKLLQQPTNNKIHDTASSSRNSNTRNVRSASSSPTRKKTRLENIEIDELPYETLQIQTNIKEEEEEEETVISIPKSKVSQPVVDFYNIETRVMPNQQFRTADDFEEWEALLRMDEDQQDQLRVELLQGHFDDNAKYVKHIWNSILSDDAAINYIYRGNVKIKKKSIKDYTFTLIFKECFRQRYERLDESAFMTHSKRFFNTVHDRVRKRIAVKERNGDIKERDDDNIWSI